jgi:tRNA threonylcarbamoyladenosine biosynthesis protein TsaB
MKMLAIETSEQACSAALWLDADVHEHFVIAPRQHSELLLPMVDQLLAEAGLVKSALDAIAFARGPGSFTGIRIAAGVAQAMGYALDRPLVAVSTLAGLAQGCHRRLTADAVAVAMDARMQEVYWGCYRLDMAGLMQLQGAESCCAPAAVSLAPAITVGCGSGWLVYADALQTACDHKVQQIDADAHCHAQDIAVLGAALFEAGGGLSPAEALPVYLRDQVATPRKQTAI